MGIFFLIVGICGMPFTAGWSLALGIIAFLFFYTGDSIQEKTQRKIKTAKTNTGALAGCLVGSFATLILFFVALALILLVSAEMLQNVG